MCVCVCVSKREEEGTYDDLRGDFGVWVLPVTVWMTMDGESIRHEVILKRNEAFSNRLRLFFLLVLKEVPLL